MSPLAWFLAGYYGLAILWGARQALPLEHSAADLLFQLTMMLTLAMWAVADARQRQRPIPRSQQVWFLLLAAIVVPAYVIVSRGWKGLAWVVLHVVGWLIVANLAMHMTGYLYDGNAWWQALLP